MKLFFLICSGLGVLLSGIFTGIIIENIRQSEQKEYNFSQKKISEISPPVLTLNTIENGILSGTVEGGQVRIFLQPKSKTQKKNIKIIQPTSPQNPEYFTLSVAEILPMLKKIPSPAGMQFVASKRGKKFYALDDPRAFLISTKNRIFFSSAKNAEISGYKKMK